MWLLRLRSGRFPLAAGPALGATKTDAKQEAVLNDTAVRVTMREVHGIWLVAGLAPRS